MTNTHQEPYLNQTKIEELESIRGIAAFLIVIFHIPRFNFVNNFNLIRNSHLMIQLFFVLSGFVIYKAYSNKLKNKKDVLRFQFLRFGRLYPVHIVFLVIYIFIELAKFYAQHKLGITTSANSQPFRENTFTALFQNIFLIQAIGPTNNAFTFNGPSWSISVEFYTYFLFALVILYLGKYKFFVFLGLCIGSLLLLVSNNNYGFGSLLSCYSGFFLGCTVAYLEEKIKITLPQYSSFIPFIAIILFLIYKSDPVYDPIMYFLTAILIFTITVSSNGYLNKILKLKLFTWLGAISYSVYMTHACIIGIFNQFIRIVFKKPEILIDGKITPQLTNFETFIAMTLLVATVLIVSTLVNKFIENPFRIKSRRYAFNKIK